MAASGEEGRDDMAPEAVHSGLSFYTPESHELPTHVIWAITVVIPVLVAITNWIMVEAGASLVSWKFGSMEDTMSEDGFALGVLTLVGISAGLAAGAAAVVFFIAPICSGSGIPEAKGYLNGNYIPGMFKPQNFFVRVIGIVLATSAGLPIGREGPMVCIGGCLGIGVVYVFAYPYMRRWVKVSADSSLVALLVHEERFAHAKKVGCVIGAAAGISTAFNAPVGAILYMIEEVTTSSWTPELTFRVFVGTVLSAYMSRFLLEWLGSSHEDVLIYADGGAEERAWGWVDLPFFVVLAAIIGLYTAVLSQVMALVWSLRKRAEGHWKTHMSHLQHTGFFNITQAVSYAVLCAIVFSLIPLSASCVPDPNQGLGHEAGGADRRRLSGGSEAFETVFYRCPEGEHNEIASLLLSGSEAPMREGAVKKLFMRTDVRLHPPSLAIALVAYTVLAAGTPGLPVPMGLFVPHMLIGALIGRLVREAVDVDLAHAGVYAMVGSGAMLAGFTHMTIAIVALLAEAYHDLSIIIPLMLGIVVSRVVARSINHHAFDEVLIIKKGLPFLEATLPEDMAVSNIVAADFCTKWPLPMEACLPPEASVSVVENALALDGLSDFPVLTNGPGSGCVGLTTRGRLEAAVKACGQKVGEPAKPQSTEVQSSELESIPRTSHSGRSIERFIEGICRGNPDELPEAHSTSRGQLLIPVHRIMDPTPHIVLEDMPMTRFHALFTYVGAPVACVVSKQGLFRGLISRANVISATCSHHEGWTMHFAADDESPAAARIMKTQPLTHNLPKHVIWSITLLIPVFVGVTNYLMVLLSTNLVGWKFFTLQRVITEHGVALGVLTLVGISLCFSAVAALLVTLVSPGCAGSGLPEAKGYMNGNYVHGMFEKTNVLVRAVGVVFATAAGLPIGREGPMVCIGGIIGIGIVHVLALPYVQSSVKMNASELDKPSLAFFVDEERFRYAKRIGCALGGAAGIATAFTAPIGSVLYMFEQVTVTSWPAELTFRAFVSSVLAALVSRGLLNLTGRDVERLVIFNDIDHNGVDWFWMDVPFFVALAAACGVASALCTRALSRVWALRQRRAQSLQRRQPLAMIVEVMAYAAVCALVFSLLPLLLGCIDLPAAGGDDGGGRRLQSDGHVRGYVRYSCPEGGPYNEGATLLLSGTQGAVKHLFSRSVEDLHLGTLAPVLVAYTLLFLGVAGLAVPMGMFLPSLFIGGLAGRFVGEALASSGIQLAHPGVYAMVGSAAMLGGFTQMTIAIVVILTEACSDLSLIHPLMLSISVSFVVSQAFRHHGFDEFQIHEKGVAFLAAELPRDMRGSDVTAGAVCRALPREARLPHKASMDVVQRALDQKQVIHFPVFGEGGACIGLITRARLLETMWACCNRLCRVDQDLTSRDLHVDHAVTEQSLGLNTVIKSLFDVSLESAGGLLIPLHRLMDPAPYTVLDEMPVARFYLLFTKAGAQAACVISPRGRFRGILSRENLISRRPEGGSLARGSGEDAQSPRPSTPLSNARDNGVLDIDSVHLRLDESLDPWRAPCKAEDVGFADGDPWEALPPGTSAGHGEDAGNPFEEDVQAGTDATDDAHQALRASSRRGPAFAPMDILLAPLMAVIGAIFNCGGIGHPHPGRPRASAPGHERSSAPPCPSVPPETLGAPDAC